MDSEKKLQEEEDIHAAAQIQADFPGEEHASFLWRPSKNEEVAVGQNFMTEDVLGNWEKILLEREPGVTSEYWD